ncbi:MAG: hypothetical protein AAF961_09555, partial [Planctomycetota bacterium]
ASRPGNLVVYENEGDETIAFVDGGQALVGIDLTGEVEFRHPLPSHTAESGGMVRTTRGADGRRWTAVSGVGWQHVFLMDEQGNAVVDFPGENCPGVASIEFLPRADGTSLCVGFWGVWGIHCVAADGSRLWVDRSLEQVSQLVAVEEKDGDNSLWCLSDRGAVVKLTDDGKLAEEIWVGSEPLMYAKVARFEAGDSLHCCGLAVSSVGRYRAVFFTPNGDVVAEYSLPKGEYGTAVERIQAVTLPGARPAWMIAAADGSLHWLDAEGAPIDRFAIGAEITGAAMTETGDAAILLVSTAEGLTAWRVEAPSAGW